MNVTAVIEKGMNLKESREGYNRWRKDKVGNYIIIYNLKKQKIKKKHFNVAQAGRGPLILIPQPPEC